MPVLSKRDQSAVVRYAMDRIDEAIAQAWMREFCAANSIGIGNLRAVDQSPRIMEQRIEVAMYLRSKRVNGRIIAKLLHRHYDMVRYYTRPALRKNKQDYNRANTGRWRGQNVNHVLAANSG